MIRAGVDSFTTGRRLSTVFEFAGLLTLLASLKAMFTYLMRVVIIGISCDIEYDLRNDLFETLVGLSSDFYGKHQTGDIMARATNDLNAVRIMLGPGIMHCCETIFTLVLALTVMLNADWRLTLMVLTPAPVVSLGVVVFGKKIHERFEAIQKAFSNISSQVHENLTGVRAVRAFVQEKAELGRFEHLNRAYIGQSISLALLSATFRPLLQTVISLTFLLILCVGGYQMISGRITLGSFVMFNTYMGMLIWPMVAMGIVVNLIQRGMASLKRVTQLVNATATIVAPARPVPIEAPLRGKIEFRDIELQYAGVSVLSGLNLAISAGSTVAIVGHTGSGKSTLVNLIPRLLDPTAGAVLADGIDVREFDPNEYRRQIGFVPQETFLFSATIGQNIAFGVPGASSEAIRRAAKIAGLVEDVDSFPQGFDTLVGERGLTLSGGQKQRTAIARAVLRDPRILILDDALSSVDTITEVRILNELSTAMRGRTTILTSHRVSTVKNADRIVVIEHGAVAEQGSHEELLEAGGYYAGLYQKQLLEQELEAI
jgi:ATP-binding cassette subfamily B protein